jgi:hypothetical protein
METYITCIIILLTDLLPQPSQGIECNVEVETQKAVSEADDYQNALHALAMDDSDSGFESGSDDCF